VHRVEENALPEAVQLLVIMVHYLPLNWPMTEQILHQDACNLLVLKTFFV
jgi:hypothetical protein